MSDREKREIGSSIFLLLPVIFIVVLVVIINRVITTPTSAGEVVEEIVTTTPAIQPTEAVAEQLDTPTATTAPLQEGTQPEALLTEEMLEAGLMVITVTPQGAPVTPGPTSTSTLTSTPTITSTPTATLTPTPIGQDIVENDCIATYPNTMIQVLAVRSLPDVDNSSVVGEIRPGETVTVLRLWSDEDGADWIYIRLLRSGIEIMGWAVLRINTAEYMVLRCQSLEGIES